MYITLMVNILGGIPKMFVFCKFLKILMVSDKTIHKAFRTHVHVQVYLSIPIRKKEKRNLTIYQNYISIGFNHYKNPILKPN